MQKLWDGGCVCALPGMVSVFLCKFCGKSKKQETSFAVWVRNENAFLSSFRLLFFFTLTVWSPSRRFFSFLRYFFHSLLRLLKKKSFCARLQFIYFLVVLCLALFVRRGSSFFFAIFLLLPFIFILSISFSFVDCFGFRNFIPFATLSARLF